MPRIIVMWAEKVIGICISNYTYVASLISSYTLRLLQMQGGTMINTPCAVMEMHVIGEFAC